MAIVDMLGTLHSWLLVSLRRQTSKNSSNCGGMETIDLSSGSGGELWDQLPHLVNAIWLLISVVNYLGNHSTSKHPRVLEIKKSIV